MGVGGLEVARTQKTAGSLDDYMDLYGGYASYIIEYS